MSRLIDADALKEQFREGAYTVKGIREEIDNALTVDAIPNKEGYEMYNKGYMSGYERGKEERPHGEWTTEKGSLVITCSVCNKGYYYHPKNDFYYNFCPKCGADMRGDST